jgi:hypothetical protein
LLVASQQIALALNVVSAGDHGARSPMIRVVTSGR